ncbi:MAG: LysR substrate-binding domain-containing protein [Chitinophagaceae bacterium]
MNIQQFQYVLAVAEYKHFELAAEKCTISQSTLSTMISKFEDEMGIKIFDRKKKPVDLTSEGLLLIEQLKLILNNIEQLRELTREIKGEVTGSLNLSVIPTIAPFLLPLFLQEFASQFPNLNIVDKEETTEEIQKKLHLREIDIGIASIPLNDKDLYEVKLYDEQFLFYDAHKTSGEKLSVNQLKNKNLCLMEEGHCIRTQVSELCNKNAIKNKSSLNFDYKAGSIDSLIRFVKASQSSTLLPYLATINFTKQEQKNLSHFTAPIPYRTIGLIVHRHFVKKKILSSLQNSIIKNVSPKLPAIELKGKMLQPVL